MSKLLNEARYNDWISVATGKFKSLVVGDYAGIDYRVVPVLQRIHAHNLPLIPLYSCQGHPDEDQQGSLRYYIVFLETEESKKMLDVFYDELLDSSLVSHQLVLERSCLYLPNSDKWYYKALSLEYYYNSTEDLELYLKALHRVIFNNDSSRKEQV